MNSREQYGRSKHASTHSSAGTADPSHEFERILADSGLHAALRFLNARTRHRFTGVYRFEAPTLRSVCLYDRENPTIKVGSDNPMLETYCSILDEIRAPFALENSATDPRVATHLARDRVISYCGVALLASDGSPRGSICHFDLRPRIVPAAEIPLMERIAPLLLDAIAQPDPC
jgi:GAF domain-containing protein